MGGRVMWSFRRQAVLAGLAILSMSLATGAQAQLKERPYADSPFVLRGDFFRDSEVTTSVGEVGANNMRSATASLRRGGENAYLVYIENFGGYFFKEPMKKQLEYIGAAPKNFPKLALGEEGFFVGGFGRWDYLRFSYDFQNTTTRNCIGFATPVETGQGGDKRVLNGYYCVTGTFQPEIAQIEEGLKGMGIKGFYQPSPGGHEPKQAASRP